MTKFSVIATILSAAALLAGCSAEMQTPAEIEINDGWARATAPQQMMGAAYLTLRNDGGSDVRLLSVTTDASTSASLHRSMMHDGVATMRSIENGLAIPAGETAMLEPGGDHIMLEGLKAPLEAGQTVTLTLSFDNGQSQQADIKVVAPGER